MLSNTLGLVFENDLSKETISILPSLKIFLSIDVLLKYFVEIPLFGVEIYEHIYTCNREYLSVLGNAHHRQFGTD